MFMLSYYLETGKKKILIDINGIDSKVLLSQVFHVHNNFTQFLQKFGTKSGKPTEKVMIASCGELTDKHIMSQRELLKMTTYREGQGEKLV